MEATFFLARPADAVGVHSIDDLPVEPATEPLAIPRLGAIRALARVLGVDPEGALRQLTDTTCQSFPIWTLSSELMRALGTLPDDEIDDVARAWLDDESAAEVDADLYELSTLVGDLRESLRSRNDIAERLCVLLEEKAF